ncbi:MAG: hypothetical protein SXA11_06805 [Cyanobacteriota bacterium]|nr:hypothetical protein [Cyanobacteriota bacterium]
MPNAELFHIDDSTAIEVAKASDDPQYLTIFNQGPDPVLVCLGGTASGDNYNNILPPGFNSYDYYIGKESFSLICFPGRSADVRVAVCKHNDAPNRTRNDAEKQRLKALSYRIFIAFIGGAVANHDENDGFQPLFPLNYELLAQESFKAGQAFMKEWKALGLEIDNAMSSRSSVD